MNDRQWEILSFRLSAIEEAAEAMDRKLDELAHISQILAGPPKDATCATCRWFKPWKDKNNTEFERLNTQLGVGDCTANGMIAWPDIETKRTMWRYPAASTYLCRHWRPKS